MPIVRVAIPVYMPRWLYRFLLHLKPKKQRSKPNASYEREIEYPFVAAYMPWGPGKALDFGSGTSFMGLIAAHRGFSVMALDLNPQPSPWRHPNVDFIQADLFDSDFASDYFDLVINCSTVEHVGLAGRYSVAEPRLDGDLEAMNRLRQLMKTGATMLLTIPVGRDQTFAPLCRIYGKKRLPRLIENFFVEKEEFWMKNSSNQWAMCNKEEALQSEASVVSSDSQKNLYCLGCFVLKK